MIWPNMCHVGRLTYLVIYSVVFVQLVNALYCIVSFVSRFLEFAAGQFVLCCITVILNFGWLHLAACHIQMMLWRARC